MLTIFSISMLGFLINHRILSSVAHDFAFSQHFVRSLLLSNLVVVGIILATASSATLLWLFIGILLITLKLFPLILRFFLTKKLRSQLIPLLDYTVLGLQSGKSFRSSLASAIENQHGWVRSQLREVFESLQISNCSIAVKSAVLKDFQQELLRIDQSKNRCVDQVKSLRQQLKMQENFRRRSGQVTQQIKMQAIIVTALYVALFVFVILQFGFKAHQNLILASLLIFVCGLCAIFLIGKGMKWKV